LAITWVWGGGATGGPENDGKYDIAITKQGETPVLTKHLKADVISFLLAILHMICDFSN
jgi:hypothetical protein